MKSFIYNSNLWNVGGLASPVVVLTTRMVGSCCSTRWKKVVMLHPCSSVVYNISGWYMVIRTGSHDHSVNNLTNLKKK